MVDDCFLDTNVLVYAAIGRRPAPAKFDMARALIAENHFGLSGQVLTEFHHVVTRKSERPLTPQEARDWLTDLVDRPCVPVDMELVLAGSRLAERYRISYWDGAILAAAETLGAPILYTEDLSHGQRYGSVHAVNPFLPA